MRKKLSFAIVLIGLGFVLSPSAKAQVVMFEEEVMFVPPRPIIIPGFAEQVYAADVVEAQMNAQLFANEYEFAQYQERLRTCIRPDGYYGARCMAGFGFWEKVTAGYHNYYMQRGFVYGHEDRFRGRVVEEPGRFEGGRPGEGFGGRRPEEGFGRPRRHGEILTNNQFADAARGDSGVVQSNRSKLQETAELLRFSEPSASGSSAG